MKRISEQNRRKNNAREIIQQEEEEAKLKKFKEFDESWQEGTDSRASSWRSFKSKINH